MLKPVDRNVLDEERFGQLFKTHFVRLSNFARQYIEDTDTCKDIVQKVFINLWEKRAQIDSEKSVISYLFTSVKNRCLNHIRDNKKFRSQLLDIDCGDIEIAIEDDGHFIEELQDQIQLALDNLPEKCRLVFEMSRFQDMKYKDIARQLDISEKTVEAHMGKALKSLRVSLGRYLTLLLWIMHLLSDKTDF
ncbi:MAG: RNA polymerase sigma-70 factor [Saprospiraceae bacterium]|nr:RNA polymerase sigma-70 factor [Saprospiraceae bacterium]MBK8503900.1 RNA polymerase sigma-70 factor [Saprospiraceae bacterium]